MDFILDDHEKVISDVCIIKDGQVINQRITEFQRKKRSIIHKKPLVLSPEVFILPFSNNL